MAVQCKVILLVEDSPDDALHFVEAMTQAHRANPIKVVSSVDEAIDYLEGTGPFANRNEFPMPSILFVNLRMPKKDGFVLLGWVGDKRQFRTIDIVAMSDRDDSPDVHRAYEMGANFVLTKPITPEHLKDIAYGFAAAWN